MTTSNLTLFQALGTKMDYLSQRQRIIAQNIANADTPGYKPKDLKEADFSSMLRSLDMKSSNVHMQRTGSGHMSASGDISSQKSILQKNVYEVTPDGNAVVIEEQLIKAQKNMMDYNLIANIYQKQVGMLNIALGKR